MTPGTLKALLAEYRGREDAMFETDDLMLSIRRVVYDRLETPERNVFLLHADGISFRRLAEVMGVSKSAVYKYFARVRRKIIHELEKEGYDIIDR